VTAPRRLRLPAALPAVLCACVLALVGCGGGAEGRAAADDPGSGMVYDPGQDQDGFRGAGLTQPYQMPDVTLTDTAGTPYHLVRDTTDPVTLVFFGYTHCPDVCNLVMADMASAITRLDDETRARVQPLFVTTDPARDSPEVVREYVDRFHPAFEGLTGEIAEIEKAAAPLGVPIEGMKRLPTGGYEVGHGSQVIGFAADDTARVVWTQGTPVEDLVADIHALAELPR
jgi:protein SCO1